VLKNQSLGFLEILFLKIEWRFPFSQILVEEHHSYAKHYLNSIFVFTATEKNRKYIWLINFGIHCIYKPFAQSINMKIQSSEIWYQFCLLRFDLELIKRQKFSIEILTEHSFQILCRLKSIKVSRKDYNQLTLKSLPRVQVYSNQCHLDVTCAQH